MRDRIAAIGFPTHPDYAVTTFRDRASIMLDDDVILHVYPGNTWSLWRGNECLQAAKKGKGEASLAVVLTKAHAVWELSAGAAA